MRLYVLLAGTMILAALALTACNSRDGSGSAARTGNSTTSAPGAPTTSMPSDGVRRVTTAELRDALEKGTAVVVDVRSPESYKSGHIKGAQNIPESEIVSRKDELPRDKTIVLYCS
jgi:3-mercaptopyruvate sulfurtransferase SseA